MNLRVLNFPGFILLLGIPVLVLMLGIFLRQKRSPRFLLYFSGFWVYLLFVANFTILPIPLHRHYPLLPLALEFNLIPFATLKLNDIQIIPNILLTVPFGFGINLIARPRPKDFFWLAPAVGLVIEGLQLIIELVTWHQLHIIDVNDALLNALGVLIGYGVYRWMRRKYPYKS